MTHERAKFPFLREGVEGGDWRGRETQEEISKDQVEQKYVPCTPQALVLTDGPQNSTVASEADCEEATVDDCETELH